jgi:hypothetical protein
MSWTQRNDDNDAATLRAKLTVAEAALEASRGVAQTFRVAAERAEAALARVRELRDALYRDADEWDNKASRYPEDGAHNDGRAISYEDAAGRLDTALEGEDK